MIAWLFMSHAASLLLLSHEQISQHCLPPNCGTIDPRQRPLKEKKLNSICCMTNPNSIEGFHGGAWRTLSTSIWSSFATSALGASGVGAGACKRFRGGGNGEHNTSTQPWRCRINPCQTSAKKNQLKIAPPQYLPSGFADRPRTRKPRPRPRRNRMKCL